MKTHFELCWCFYLLFLAYAYDGKNGLKLTEIAIVVFYLLIIVLIYKRCFHFFCTNMVVTHLISNLLS